MSQLSQVCRIVLKLSNLSDVSDVSDVFWCHGHSHGHGHCFYVKSKSPWLSEWLSEWVSQWQGLLLSCSGQLKIIKVSQSQGHKDKYKYSLKLRTNSGACTVGVLAPTGALCVMMNLRLNWWTYVRLVVNRMVYSLEQSNLNVGSDGLDWISLLKTPFFPTMARI